MKKTAYTLVSLVLLIAAGLFWKSFEANLSAGENPDRHAVVSEARGQETLAAAGAENGRGHGEGPSSADDVHEAEAEICAEHGIPESEDALCQPETIGLLQPGQGMKVRLESPDGWRKAGVSISTPGRISLAGCKALPGRTEFNRRRFARVPPMVPGIVQQIPVVLGQQVQSGDVLVELAAPELSTLKSELLSARAREVQAKADFQREKDLLERNITSLREYQAAEAEYKTRQSETHRYRQQLLDLGLSPRDIETLLRSENRHSRLQVRAPFSGVVSEVHAAIGEAVGPDTAIMTITDLDTLWIAVSVPEALIYQVRRDLPITADFDGLPGRVFSGRIFQVGTSLDSKSRTLKVLAEVENPDHLLKAGMYGRVRFSLPEEKVVSALPAAAVQDIDGKPYVFILLEPDLFELRRIDTKRHIDGLVPVVRGVAADDKIAVSQAFALKSEVLKARLGASCVD